MFLFDDMSEHPDEWFQVLLFVVMNNLKLNQFEVVKSYTY
jgi:hypothetical protein